MPFLVDKSSKAILPLIRKRIMLPVDAENPPAEFKQGKFMIFIGGGNASGKTVVNNLIFSELEKEGYNSNYVAKFGSSIFEDILSNKLLQSARIRIEHFMHSAAASNSDAEHSPGYLKQVAIKAFTSIRSEVMDMGAPVVIDYHMHDIGFVKDCVEDAKKHGYECILITPHLDAENIFSRVEERFKRTRRPYKLDKILTRHRQFAENLDAYLDMFDLSVVLDNNKENHPPTIIAISHLGNTQILNKESYDNVKRKIHLNANAKSAGDVWEKDTEHSFEGNDKSKSGTVGTGNTADNGAGERNASNGHFARMIEKDIVGKLSLP